MFSPNHYLVRIGDSKNFWNSSPIGIWGMKILNRGVKPGDILWFISKGGKLEAVATFKTIRGRTYTDEELGWSGAGGWTKEILYQDLYDIRSLDLQTKNKGATSHAQI